MITNKLLNRKPYCLSPGVIFFFPLGIGCVCVCVCVRMYVCAQLLSLVWPFVTPWTVAHQLLCPWDFQARMLEWASMPSSRGASRPGIKTTSPVAPALADRFFTTTYSGSSVSMGSASLTWSLLEFIIGAVDWIVPFCRKDFSIHGFWNHPGSWNPSPVDGRTTVPHSSKMKLRAVHGDLPQTW